MSGKQTSREALQEYHDKVWQLTEWLKVEARVAHQNGKFNLSTAFQEATGKLEEACYALEDPGDELANS